MQFFVDADHGSWIDGWLAPDNPGVEPRVRIIVPGREDVVVEANVMRADVVEVGLHGSGRVGFIIDDTIVEDLAQQSDVKIVDFDSGVPIFRRNVPDLYLQKKLFYVDPSLMPQNSIYKSINANFCLQYNFVEKFAFDTMSCLINREHSASIVLTGRPYLSRYAAHFKNKGFFTAAVFGDPLEELAERLLFVQLLSKSSASHLLPNFVTGVEALVDFVADLNLNDDKALAAAFRSSSEKVRTAISNPITKVMGGNPNEDVERRHVGIALDNLSSIDVVGLKSRFDDFRTILAGRLGADVLSDYAGVSAAVDDLTNRMARIPIVKNFLELDLALYSYAEEAVETGLMTEA